MNPKTPAEWAEYSRSGHAPELEDCFEMVMEQVRREMSLIETDVLAACKASKDIISNVLTDGQLDRRTPCGQRIRQWSEFLDRSINEAEQCKACSPEPILGIGISPLSGTSGRCPNCVLPFSGEGWNGFCGRDCEEEYNA